MTTDFKGLLERDLVRIGPAPFTIGDVEALGAARRRRSRLVSISVMALLTVLAVTAVARLLPQQARAPLDDTPPPVSIDLTRVVVDESATPLRTEPVGLTVGLEALLRPLDTEDVQGRAVATIGYVQAVVTEFERKDPGPGEDDLFASWAAEYDGPRTAHDAMQVFMDTFHYDWGFIDPRPVRLRHADEGVYYVDRSIPRTVIFIWRQGSVLLHTLSSGDFPPADVRRIAEAIDARASMAIAP
jgi:hypothetical protein